MDKFSTNIYSDENATEYDELVDVLVDLLDEGEEIIIFEDVEDVGEIPF